MKKSFYILVFFIILTQISGFAEEINAEKSLNYTYIGPLASIGYSNVTYNHWKDEQYKEHNSSGMTFSGGVVICTVSNIFMGDTRLKYTYNGSGAAITYSEIALSGKYIWNLKDTFNTFPEDIDALAGLGVYCEAPPSNKTYNGSAGLEIPFGVMFKISNNMMLMGDMSLRYGSFGIGENSSQLSFGLSFSFLTKVGTI